MVLTEEVGGECAVRSGMLGLGGCRGGGSIGGSVGGYAGKV